MCPLPVRTPPSGGRSCPGCPVDRACEPFPVTRAHKSLANLLPRGLFTVQRGLRLLHLGNVGLERYGMIRSRRLKAIVLGEAIYIIAAWKMVADAWTPGQGENNGAGWLIFFAILPLALILRILGVRLTGDFLLGYPVRTVALLPVLRSCRRLTQPRLLSLPLSLFVETQRAVNAPFDAAAETATS